MGQESGSRGINIFEALGAPVAWYDTMHVSIKDSDDIESQNKRWEALTGLKPQESSFTLIVPIHNEQNYISASLGALMLSDIPDEVHMNVLLVTNACTDNSVAMVETFMQATALDKRKGFNWRFQHIDTPVAGKANALNIGNTQALEAGHKIALSMDANNFPESDAVPILFAEAYRSIVGFPTQGVFSDGTAVLSGLPIHVKRRPSRSKLMAYTERQKKLEFPNLVRGWLMAWDTDFIEREGGIPRVLTEDYAVGYLARSKGYKVRQINDARIWGYDADNLPDRWHERVRFMAGTLQTFNLSPEIAALIMAEESEIMGDLRIRAQYAINLLFGNKREIPYHALRLVLRELVRIRAKALVKKNPTTWTQIKSTK